eukprot:TRINITY_DN7332_c0_g1_i1.p1 TRINITY_DN7332_c0_g1~~TRINITY_DN7332_c0_g1_i1.p1  ORF type:complete len:139 (+),score=20.02 TRINITY_DN7332_c0_g1_i1:414-830(+)
MQEQFSLIGEMTNTVFNTPTRSSKPTSNPGSLKTAPELLTLLLYFGNNPLPFLENRSSSPVGIRNSEQFFHQESSGSVSPDLLVFHYHLARSISRTRLTTAVENGLHISFSAAKNTAKQCLNNFLLFWAAPSHAILWN